MTCMEATSARTEAERRPFETRPSRAGAAQGRPRAEETAEAAASPAEPPCQPQRRAASGVDPPLGPGCEGRQAALSRGEQGRGQGAAAACGSCSSTSEDWPCGVSGGRPHHQRQREQAAGCGHGGGGVGVGGGDGDGGWQWRRRRTSEQPRRGRAECQERRMQQLWWQQLGRPQQQSAEETAEGAQGTAAAEVNGTSRRHCGTGGGAAAEVGVTVGEGRCGEGASEGERAAAAAAAQPGSGVGACGSEVGRGADSEWDRWGGEAQWRRRRRLRCSALGRPLLSSQMLVSLLLAATALLVSGPCPAAAAWSWALARSRAASGAVSAAASAATPAGPGGWSFSGLLPYGWRKHNNDGSSSSSSGRSHSSSKARGTGKAGVFGGGGGGGGGVTFSAGVVPVAVNPAGNVTELLEHDPYTPPPPSPPPPGPPGSGKPRGSKHRRGWKHSRQRALTDAQLALRELLVAPRSERPPYDIMKPYKLPAVSYKNSDFVFATGSFPARYILAQSTRSWRHGIRAFIAINDTEDVSLLNEHNRVHNEHYSYFPDDGTAELGPVYHGCMAGDTRAAMAPFLAHTHFGESYKWMLYGDDDTVFYMPAVKRLLAHLDPELPFAISDNLWFRARHPNLFAPRCLPCHLAVDADPPPPPPPPPETAGGAAASAAAGSHESTSKPLRIPNITSVMEGYQRFLLGVRSAADMESARVQKLLSKNTFGDFNKSLAAIAHLPPDASVPGIRYVPRPACPFCTAQAACDPTPPTNHNVSGAGCFASGGHGGAGMIFSVGLLRRLSPERMKACYLDIFKAAGGDGMLSTCLWEAGYAFTDPGASTLARYDGNYLLFSSEAAKWALHDPLTVLLRGKCDGRCKWLLRNAASHHGRGRHFQNFEQSAAYMYSNMASYIATHKWLAFMAGRDDDLEELAGLVAAEAAAGAAGAEGGDGAGEGGSMST